jgi:hypothetical protein
MRLFPEPDPNQRAEAMADLRRMLRWLPLWCGVIAALVIPLGIADGWNHTHTVFVSGLAALGVLAFLAGRRPWRVERPEHDLSPSTKLILALAVSALGIGVAAIAFADADGLRYSPGFMLVVGPVVALVGVVGAVRAVRELRDRR